MEGEEDHGDFQKGDAGAGLTYPCPCNDIKKGGHIMMKEKPCRVSEISVSKTGKHGHAKCNFTALDIFTNKKLEDVIPSTHTTSVPHVSRAEYTVSRFSANFVA